jgi:hypothetical protein
MAGGPGGFGGPLGADARKVVTGAPFSATFTTTFTQTLSDGNVVTRTNSSQFARDSQGRTMTQETVNHMGPWSSSTGPKTMIFINDPVAGQAYTLDPAAKTASQHTIPARTVSSNETGNAPGGRNRMAHQPDANTVVESLGADTIQGLAVTGTKITRTIPAGTIGNQSPIVEVSTRWVSTALQTVIISTHTDPRTGTTTFTATNIIAAEPSPALFKVSSDYTVTAAKPQMRMRQ